MDSLYVCLFSNGHIKVGRSGSAAAGRIRQHAARVECIGIDLNNSRIFPCAGHSFPAEQQLLEKCESASADKRGDEWFSGLDFDAVCTWAEEIALMKFAEPERKQSPARKPESIALDQAIDAAGGISELARALELKSHGVIHQWRFNGVPAKYCPDLECLTGVPCESLCPEVNWAVLRGRPASTASI